MGDEGGRGRGARPIRGDDRTRVVALGEVPVGRHHPDQEAGPEAPRHRSPPPPPLASAARVLTIVLHAALAPPWRAGSRYCSTAFFRSTARCARARCRSATAPVCARAVARPWRRHRARLGVRGFTQALLLARALGRRRGLPVAPRLLVRTRATEAQARLPAAERRRNLDGAFAVRAPHLCTARSIVLVDDVLTTGATADACARALLAAGAARVDVYTVGRAP